MYSKTRRIPAVAGGGMEWGMEARENQQMQCAQVTAGLRRLTEGAVPEGAPGDVPEGVLMASPSAAGDPLRSELRPLESITSPGGEVSSAPPGLAKAPSPTAATFSKCPLGARCQPNSSQRRCRWMRCRGAARRKTRSRFPSSTTQHPLATLAFSHCTLCMYSSAPFGSLVGLLPTYLPIPTYCTIVCTVLRTQHLPHIRLMCLILARR